MRKTITTLAAMLLALTMMTTAASAVQTGDFIGKGEVQTHFGWNNSQLQANADRVLVTATTETEWSCSRPHPTQDREIVQERSSETTTSATTVGRLRNQITGFFVGDVLSTSTDGPAVGSCPANPSGFTFDEGSQTTGVTTYSFSLR